MPSVKYAIPLQVATVTKAGSNDAQKAVGACFVLEPSLQIISAAHNVIVLPTASIEEKLLASAHAEKLAIAEAHAAGWANLSRLTLVVTRHPCSHCMIDIWLSGCRRVVHLDEDETVSKWQESFRVAREIAAEKKIELLRVPRGSVVDVECAELQEKRRLG